MCGTEFMRFYRRRDEMLGGATPLIEVLEHTTDFRLIEVVPGRGVSESPMVQPARDPVIDLLS